MLHFQSSEQMTSVHAPNKVNAGIAIAISCLEGTAWMGKHEVSGKCCCNWGKKDIIQKLSNQPTHPIPLQHSTPLQTVADEGIEKNGLCSKKGFFFF